LFRVRSPAFIDRDTCGRRPRDTASRAPTGWRQFCHCLRQVSWTDAPLRQPRAGGQSREDRETSARRRPRKYGWVVSMSLWG
jgi:hypothetical protein